LKRKSEEKMLSAENIQDIRFLLENSQNPLFFFDNDPDGLASYLLLRRHIKRGKGVVIKSFPDLNESYTRKLYELQPDYVFVLDKPLIASTFIEKTLQLGMKLVWIDHHPLQETENIYYFNPLKTKPSSNEPTSYWCYKVTNKKDDMWISLLGCIGDWFVPYFYQEVKEDYPDLFSSNIKTASQILYRTQFGRLAKILSLALKDKTSIVVRMLKFLVSVKTPYELLEENYKTRTIYRRFKQINRKYEKLLEKAKTFARKKLLFFQYGGDLSISGELANELLHTYQDKIIAVAYIKGEEAKISIRGSINIREIVTKAIHGLEGRSGGHENACAATIAVSDLPRFRERVEKLI
jgi:single-stranded DNA-specific DHH superfamily exonuclease